MLTIPVPELAYDSVAPGVAALELPVTITLGPVFDDGVPQTPVQLNTFGLVARRRPAAGVTEVWDARHQQWLPDGAGVEPTPLAYLPDQPAPWQAILVAAGGEQFAESVAGYPSYWFRALFSTPAGETALSGSSAPVTFASASEKELMVLGPGDGEQPDNATRARLQLKNTGLQIIGGLVVRRDSPGAEVTLSNAAGASVVLNPDGSIGLRPAPGRRVVVAADLETERVTYLPAGGGTKKTLV